MTITTNKEEAWKGISAVDFNLSQFQDNEEAQNLLRAIHGGLYSKTFPLPEEQEDVEEWIKRALEDGRKPNQFITAHFSDLGAAVNLSNQIAQLKKLETLTEEQQKKLQETQDAFDKLTVGFVVGEVYQDTKAGLINYVIRNKEFDIKDENGNPKYPAKAMVDHQVAQYQEFAKSIKQELDFVGWEANDPRKTPFFNEKGQPDFDVDVMDPNRRVQILEQNLGAFAIRNSQELWDKQKSELTKKSFFTKNFFDKEDNDLIKKMDQPSAWTQSALDPTQKVCATLLMYSYPLKKDLDKDGKITPEALERKAVAYSNFVNAFHETFPEKGRFTSDEQGTATEKYANHCKETYGLLRDVLKTTKIEPNRDKELQEFLKSDGREELVEKIREKLFEDRGGDKKSLNFKEYSGFVADELKDKGFDGKHANAVLGDVFKELKTEMLQSYVQVDFMAKNLKELQQNPDLFKDKPKADNEAVKNGQKLLKEYYSQEEKKQESRENFSKTKGYWENLIKERKQNQGVTQGR